MVDAGTRHPPTPRRVGIRMLRDRDEARLGGAENPDPGNTLAGRRKRQFVEGIADRLRDAGARILQDPNPAEEVFAQRTIPLQPWQELFIPLRNIRVKTRRNLLEVASRLFDLARQRLAIIDVERAAVVQGGSAQNGAAKEMAPGQPNDEP